MEKLSQNIHSTPSWFSPLVNQRLAQLEERRDARWGRHSRVITESLYWKACVFRHINHLLPGQSILEIGSGKGYFTEQLRKVSEGHNPITTLNFSRGFAEGSDHLSVGPQWNQTFDVAVGIDILDEADYTAFFHHVYDLLKPSGRLLLFQRNPWNLLRRPPFAGRKNNSSLPDKKQLLGVITETGFIHPHITNYNFVYGPLAAVFPRFLRNMSIILENTPAIQDFSDSLIIAAQKPPQQNLQPAVSLCVHPELRQAFSVVIPCRNEEMNVKPLVAGLKGFYGDYLHEIILVDDNSSDSTAAVLQTMAQQDPLIKPVFRKPPNGVGLAIADGLRKATGEYIVTMDCDFQHLLPEIRDMFEAVFQGYDVVVGSRFSRHSILLNYPLPKIVANRGFHVLAMLLLGKKFRDLTNNMKMMRRSVADNLQLTQTGFGANAETGFKPLLMGYSVKEIPISWINRTPDMGVSSFRLMKAGSGYAKVLWQLCRQSRFGRRQVFPQEKPT